MKKIYKIGFIAGLGLIAASSALWVFSRFGPFAHKQNMFAKATIKERSIIQAIPYLQMLLGEYFMKNMHYPGELEELKYMKSNIALPENIESLLKDPYAKPNELMFHYSINEDYSKCSITSVGNDRLNGTTDDITIIFEHGGIGNIKCNPKEHPYLDKLVKEIKNK